MTGGEENFLADFPRCAGRRKRDGIFLWRRRK